MFLAPGLLKLGGGDKLGTGEVIGIGVGIACQLHNLACPPPPVQAAVCIWCDPGFKAFLLCAQSPGGWCSLDSDS